jgi:HK97 family phage prohead protease
MKRMIAGYAVRADEQGPIVWLASSPDKARDGMRIPVDAWDTDAFVKQGSPLMWAHKYDEAPIGRVTKLERTKAGLIAETEFTDLTARGRETEQLVRAGWLNCCSVGFEVHDMKGDEVVRASLMELSVVPIGSDVNAVALARSAFGGDAPFTYPNPFTPDAEPDAASVAWDEAAASMVRLFVAPTQRPEADRTPAYRALARTYARHGKTPPELLDAEVVTALGPDELRGLFLEGEPDLFPDTFALGIRAGAVLSRRNLDAIERAIALLQEVRERAATEAETPEPETPTDDDALARLHAALTRAAP